MSTRVFLAIFCLSFVTGACGKQKIKIPEECKVPTAKGLGSGGTGLSFWPDPLSGSGNLALTPYSSNLDSYSDHVDLQNLSGKGVLDGTHISVVDGNSCGGTFSAFSDKNNFSYKHSDLHFQEAMSYYVADRYLSFLSAQNANPLSKSLKLIAHCGQQDNAFYVWTSTGGIVCLGDSISSPGASYADDGLVTVHETQHAITTQTYSSDPSMTLNGFWQAEGGALNEGISDFMGLMFTESETEIHSLDTRLFGRWSLGLYDSTSKATRGAHRCPAYDPSYPECASFPAFSAKDNHVSYVYPDGLGWPYPKNETAAAAVKAEFDNGRGQEEIHGNGVLIQGALWEAYQGMKAVALTHGHSADSARSAMTQLLMDALKHLPLPTDANISPTGFIELARALVNSAQAQVTAGTLDADSATALHDGLALRGLLPTGADLLPAGWLDLETTNVPGGVKVLDSPSKLKSWISDLFGTTRDLGIIPQSVATGLNGKLDPGEVAGLWFDLKDTSTITAGNVYLKMTIPNEDLDAIEFHNFASPRYTINIGAISNAETHISYGKINGTGIVQALSVADPSFSSYAVSTGSSYFKTNPFYDRTYWDAVFVKVNAQAAHGRVVHIDIEATPSNGPAASKRVSITLN